jgi:hypothetical protein
MTTNDNPNNDEVMIIIGLCMAVLIIGMIAFALIVHT